MYFSDIVKQEGTGKFNFEKNPTQIFRIRKGPIIIEFGLEDATLICGEIKHKIKLTEFSKVTFKTVKKPNTTTDEKEVEGYFNKEKLFTVSETSGESLKQMFDFLSQSFTDAEESTPKFQVEQQIENYELNESPSYNPHLYKLLIEYKDMMDKLYDNGILKPKSKILYVVEEESGNVIAGGNLQATAKKALNNVFSKGFGSLGSLAIGVAKSAGSRLVKQTINDMFGSKGLMVLTDKNVILAAKEKQEEYDFEDFQDIFQDRPDEVLSGVVDIFMEGDYDTPILNNVAQDEWATLKRTLRELKKNAHTSANFIEDDSISDDDEMAELEAKLTKLQSLVTKGLLSQEDFDKKKAELLSAI